MLRNKVRAIYCWVGYLLKEMDHNEHNDRKYNDGQVITTALVSALHLRGDRTMSLHYMGSHVFDDMPKRAVYQTPHKLKEVLLFIKEQWENGGTTKNIINI